MRRRRLIALVLLVLLVAASVSYTSGYTLDIVDKEERPQTVYALYIHQGYWLNPVHPVSYNATRLTVVRSDDNGRLTIPAAFHVHWPFPLQTHPKLSIKMIYVPRLHNVWARIVERSPGSEVGIWQMTTQNRAMVLDVSDRPERWHITLSNLSFYMSPAVRDVDHSRAGPLLELIGHFRAEYNAFLVRHNDSPGYCRRCLARTSRRHRRGVIRVAAPRRRSTVIGTGTAPIGRAWLDSVAVRHSARPWLRRRGPSGINVAN